MIDSQRGAQHRVGYNHLVSNKREWNNCLIKNSQGILLDLAYFALQEQPEDNLMVFISRTWYNGSYTMAAKPIKFLELHYTMVQFLPMADIPWALMARYANQNSGITLSNEPIFNNFVIRSYYIGSYEVTSQKQATLVSR